jgi:hypothetical protein
MRLQQLPLMIQGPRSEEVVLEDKLLIKYMQQIQ